jgi:quercetin dioxygenase-like cupin family protein
VAIAFNESTVTSEPASPGVARQRLLTRKRVPSTNILLDRLSLSPGANFEISVALRNLAWFQILGGNAIIANAGAHESLSNSHVAFLPPGFHGTLSTERDVTLLYAEVPDAERFDPALAAHPPAFRVLDWSREPVLRSEHDARKRIYLVTPKLFGTKAIKGEMIIYPPGTTAANHHHEGAEHFMYILRGHGTAYSNEKPFPVRAGDVIYYADRERHYLSAAGEEDMVFSEFFAPGECTTIWVDNSKICAWLPTGRDINGGAPSREIHGHSSADFAIPKDV